MRIWVAHGDCAKIIGKGGRTMRETEARSRSKLKVQKEDEMNKDTKERYIDIAGTKKEQSSALELLLDLATYCREDEGKVLKDTRAAADDSTAKAEAPLVLEVHPDDIGSVLGRKGETVKQLEQDSGAKIELNKASGRLEIIGSSEAQEKARELLLSKVSFAKAEDGAVIKDQAQSAADDTPPFKLWVKDSEAGRVIGTGGETVRDIRERTGAEVKVQKNTDMDPGSTEREILIFGEPEKRDEALRLILAEVSWARGEDGPLKASAEDEGRRREEKRPKKQHRERRTKERRVRRGRSSGGKEKSRRRSEGRARDSGDKPGVWVCATCGGDHRTKACPHETGVLGMGMQIGMQMGMQQAMAAGGLPMGMMAPTMMPGMHPMGMVPGMMPMGLGAPLLGFGGPGHGGSRSSSGSSSGESGSSGDDQSSAQSDASNDWHARLARLGAAAAEAASADALAASVADGSVSAAPGENAGGDQLQQPSRSRSPRHDKKGRRRRASRARKDGASGPAAASAEAANLEPAADAMQDENKVGLDDSDF